MKSYKSLRASCQKEATYPHMMYHPDTGEEVKVANEKEHEKYAKLGYGHDKPMKESVDTIEEANIADFRYDIENEYMGSPIGKGMKVSKGKGNRVVLTVKGRDLEFTMKTMVPELTGTKLVDLQQRSGTYVGIYEKAEVEEGSIKGSGKDMKAKLKKAFRAGEMDTRAFNRGGMSSRNPARNASKAIKKAYQAGRLSNDGSSALTGKARMKSQDRLRREEVELEEVSKERLSFKAWDNNEAE